MYFTFLTRFKESYLAMYYFSTAKKMWQISREILWYLQSISSMFTRAFFVRNFNAKSCTKLTFGFEILAPKISHEKCVRKTLMKMTPCVRSLHNINHMISIQKYYVLAILACSPKLMKIKVWGWCYKHFWTPSLGVYTPKS